ncbi:zona pellucida sperm-binding protein 3-like [Nelusetta ayraudi]|uniref:zona pellucida sperm-binding protein 3-like n=1 Tax=Nelusetta ayraudi TaxID=303726 RepID=UPI003F7007E1
MVTRRYLGVTILAVIAITVAHADIDIVCLKNSVGVTWNITAELVPYAGRLFLGNCVATKLKVLPSGDGVVQFNYPLTGCKFVKETKGKYIFFKNKMTYKPYAKSKTPQYEHHFHCRYKRSQMLSTPFLNPGSGFSEGRGGLVFSMRLLKEHLQGFAETNLVRLGSFIPIMAEVEQKSHQPLLLLMDECVAAFAPELHPGSRVHPIVGNKGCVLEGTGGNAKFYRGNSTSEMILSVHPFNLPAGVEVYIHCNLLAWDPETLDESKKACNYDQENGRWELLDDPRQNSLCSCCDSTCKSRPRRGVHLGSQGFSHKSVLGPLIIVDPSDLMDLKSSSSTEILV